MYAGRHVNIHEGSGLPLSFDWSAISTRILRFPRFYRDKGGELGWSVACIMNSIINRAPHSDVGSGRHLVSVEPHSISLQCIHPLNNQTGF